MRKITRMSSSQLDSFDWCPLQWKLRYVDKRKGEVMPHALLFGIAFHAGIEKYLQNVYFDGINDINVCRDNALSTFDYAYTLSPGGGTELDKWLPQGEGMLIALMDSIEAKGLTVNEIEGWYSKQLRDDVKFTGKIDCRASLGGKSVIIDWKTTSKPYTQWKIDRAGQLTRYKWLVGDCDELYYVTVHKDTCEVEWHQAIRTDIDVAKELLTMERTLKEMETRKTFRGRYDEWCDKCDMNGIWCGGQDSDF